jgi:hypothetical protein
MPETREHVPPRVFLDKPYPSNLPVVEACKDCNNGFSLDEEYLSCLLECVISGSTDPEKLHRENISRKVAESPSLAKRLRDAFKQEDGETSFEVEYDRVKSVVEKVAKGHVLFELNELYRDDPQIGVTPFPCLSENEIFDFESLPQPTVWPEVGSRGMQRLIVGDDSVSNGWIIVQPNRYRYAVLHSDGIEVRMVFSEYLACVVRWEQ